ncbi:MAG TPA: FtsX-like permease family protein [Thermoanaerobaculia bacterium]|nr:FtsX-like permease family protein [Thermoanaerobaculia bacterium]
MSGRPRLLRGPLVWTVAWRFLRGSRSRLLDGTARAALLATALGVTAMVIAMALMTGYREDLQSKLIRGNAAVVAYPLEGGAGAPLDRSRIDRLRRIPGVLQVGRVAYGQGSLAGPGRPDGVEVVLRGVEAGGGQLAATAADLALSPQGIPGVAMGSDLAARLAVRPGAVLRLVVLGFAGGTPRFRFQSVQLRRTFTTGFAEFDRSWVLLERSRVEALMGLAGGADLLELAVVDPGAAPRIADAAARVLAPSYAVTDWQQLNRELFTALRVQQAALFVVLGLIVLVSTFNVASTLVVLVRERLRDIGVLGALGLAPARLRLVFLTYGAILGSLGTLLGVAVGSAAAWTLTTYRLIRFDSDVAAIYFVSFVPFRVAGRDLAAVVGFALGVTLLACCVPAWRAARLDPSAALRYE